MSQASGRYLHGAEPRCQITKRIAEAGHARGRSQTNHQFDLAVEVRLFYHGDIEERTAERMADVDQFLLASLL